MAIASAEAIEPEIYVMDEPSANLDTDSTERLGNTIRKLKEKGKTMLIAEHRLYYLMPIADRFLYIKDGRIMHEFTQAEIRQLAAEEIRKRGDVYKRQVPEVASQNPAINLAMVDLPDPDGPTIAVIDFGDVLNEISCSTSLLL